MENGWITDERFYINDEQYNEIYRDDNGDTSRIVGHIGINKNGMYQEFENKKLVEIGKYKDNCKVGEWKGYYENGKIKNIERYQYNAFAKKTFPSDMDEQNRTGIWVTYFENGQVYTTGEYADGKKNGTWQTYYNNGQLKTEEVFLNDILNGYKVQYSQDGTLISKTKYENGKKVN